MSNVIQGEYMKTIAVSLQKGGVGKTTLAVSLAVELAKESGSVVLVDADPQGNSSSWIGPDLLDYELADVLTAKKEEQSAILEKTVLNTGIPGLYLLPTIGLSGGLKPFENTARDRPGCFRGIVTGLENMGFRYCVFDLSPAFGPIEKAALIVSHEVITPVMPDAFGLDGLTIFSNNMKELKNTLEEMGLVMPAYSKICINGIDNRIGQHREILTKMREYGETFSLYEIPVDPSFRKGQGAGLTIQELAAAKKETLSALYKLAKDLMEG
jgi:chromosome partitioning protein